MRRSTLLAAAGCAVAAVTAITASGCTTASTHGTPASTASAGSTSSGGAPSATAPVSTGIPGKGESAAWPAYGGNQAHTGAASAAEPAAGTLSVRWRASLDGAVYGQPLAVGGDVIAATENDTVYALNPSTGQAAWKTHLGTPVPQSAQHGCGDIFPLGITGTPAYDQANGLVYTVAETSGYQFTLFGLSARTGAVALKRVLTLAAPGNDPAWDQQRPALTIANGRVYVAWGGLDGDCGTYRGGVLGVPLSGKGAQVTFLTPTSREGAVWGTSGPAPAANGDLWIAIGNGAASSGAFDGSDSVTVLSPTLRRVGYFAPSTWADDNANDKDLGSTQPVLAAGNSAFIMGKRGTGYLLSSTNPAGGSLGGIGGQVAQQSVCTPFGAAAVSGSTVYEPCRNSSLTAISVSAAQRRIQVRWSGPAEAGGSPVIGGGAIWATDYAASDGILYELNLATGAVRNKISVGTGLPHFSSLSLAGGTAYVSTLSGVVAVSGA
jgi:hypothetical protein